MSKFLARRTTVSTFLPPLPRYSDLSSTQCPFLSRRKTRKILLTGTKPSSWLVDQPRDARNYPLHGFGATVDLAMRSKFSAVSIVSIPLRFDNFSRGTVSFLFFLAFRRDKASYRIEGRCDEFIFLLFSLFFFLSLEEKGREVRNKIPYYSKFPRSNRRRCNIVHDDRRFYSDYFATRANEWNVDDGCVRSCEAS